MSRLKLPDWLPSHEERAARDRLLAARFVLVRIAGNAGYDTMRCRRCNGKHPYLTLMCEPQPFSGASRGLYGYFHTLGIAGAEQFMTPRQRERFERIAAMFRQGPPTGDLATLHPQTARGIATDERDQDIGAVALGVLEEVSRPVAMRLVERINGKGLRPPLVVEGLNDRIGESAPLSVLAGRR